MQQAAALRPHTKEQRSEAFKEAYRLWKRGWSVFPCTQDKKPNFALIATWKQFKKRLPTEAEMQSWQDSPAFAVVTGPLSDVKVQDDDSHGESLKGRHLPETPCASTPSGGIHYYYRYPRGRRLKEHAVNIYGKGSKVDAPGYVLLPGSEGRAWCPDLSPDDVELAEAPECFVAAIESGPAPVTGPEQVQKELKLPDSEHVNKYALDDNAPTPLHELSNGQLSGYFRDEQVVLKVAPLLGIQTSGIGKACFDVMPNIKPDTRKSGALYKADNGIHMFHSFRTEAEFYTLGEVYASQHYGVETKFVPPKGHPLRMRPEGVVWSTRLLVDAGVIKPAKVPHKPVPRKPPKDAPPYVKQIHEGLLHLFGCRWRHTYGNPATYTWDFAAAWCGVPFKAAGAAIQWLCNNGYVEFKGKCGRANLYLLRKPDAGKTKRPELPDTTEKHKTATVSHIPRARREGRRLQTASDRGGGNGNDGHGSGGASGGVRS